MSRFFDSRLGLAVLGTLALGTVTGELSPSFSSAGSSGASFVPVVTLKQDGAAAAAFTPFVTFRQGGASSAAYTGTETFVPTLPNAVLGRGALGAFWLGHPVVYLAGSFSSAGAAAASFTPYITVESDGGSSASFTPAVFFEEDGAGSAAFDGTLTIPTEGIFDSDGHSNAIFIPSLSAATAIARFSAIPGLGRPGEFELGRPRAFTVPALTFQSDGSTQATFLVGLDGAFECDGASSAEFGGDVSGQISARFRCDGKSSGSAASSLGTSWRGGWNSNDNYVAGDVISYGGFTYKSIDPSGPGTGAGVVTPGSDPTVWQQGGSTGSGDGSQTGTSFTPSVIIFDGTFRCDGKGSAFWIGRYFGVRIGCIVGFGSGSAPPPIEFVGPTATGGSSY